MAQDKKAMTFTLIFFFIALAALSSLSRPARFGQIIMTKSKRIEFMAASPGKQEISAAAIFPEYLGRYGIGSNGQLIYGCFSLYHRFR